ncbi:MAG: hypothetical protein U5L45_22270 [Saprospiraceae bacterium]|nr:hypothetical protein [Saprospiraceae bacterium]
MVHFSGKARKMNHVSCSSRASENTRTKRTTAEGKPATSGTIVLISFNYFIIHKHIFKTNPINNTFVILRIVSFDD